MTKTNISAWKVLKSSPRAFYEGICEAHAKSKNKTACITAGISILVGGIATDEIYERTLRTPEVKEYQEVCNTLGKMQSSQKAVEREIAQITTHYTTDTTPNLESMLEPWQNAIHAQKERKNELAQTAQVQRYNNRLNIALYAVIIGAGVIGTGYLIGTKKDKKT